MWAKVETQTGALRFKSFTGGGTGGADVTWVHVDLDAARCSDRYGAYTEINPLYESCKFYIRY